MEAALIAFQIATLERLLFFFYGAIIGLALGAMARLGGLIELAILLPFTFDTTNRISWLSGMPDVFHFNVDVPWSEDLWPRAKLVPLAGVEALTLTLI